jgi:hypothetical protein
MCSTEICSLSLIIFHRWYIAGRALDDVRELASVKELPMHSMPRSEPTTAPSIDLPVKAEEGLNDTGVPLTGSTSSSSIPNSWPQVSNPDPDPQVNPSVIAEPFLTRPIDPAAATPSVYDVSYSGSATASPPAPLGSNWWNGSMLAHALRQAPPAIDATHPNLTLSPSTSASFNSLDALLGVSTKDPALVLGFPPGQMHVSDDEMEAWLKAPAGWQWVSSRIP